MPITVQDAAAMSAGGLLYGLPKPPPDWEQKPEGISLCMIVRDEERFLGTCLESVRDVVDEICIVDTGSADGTIEIARSFGARIEHREWRDDFAWARNESLALAGKRWTLVLDADEELTAESGVALRSLRTVPAHLTAVYLRIVNVVNELEGEGTMSHSLPRIFPTHDRVRYCNVIHENIALDGTQPLPGVLSPVRVLHKGYTRDVLASKKKDERNLPLLRRATEVAAGDGFSWYNYGMAAVGAGDTDEGIAAFEKMFEIDRGARGYVPSGYVALAAAYGHSRNDFVRAHATIDACLEKVPHYVNAHFCKGSLYLAQREYEPARECFKRAIADRQYAESYFLVDDEIFSWKAQFNIAVSFLRDGKPEEAVAWYDEALKGKPESWLIQRARAGALEAANRFFDAELAYRKMAMSFATDAANVDYLNYLLRRKRYARALEVIRSVAETASPQAAVSMYTTAAVVSERTGSGEGEAFLRRALAIAPGSGEALAMLEARYAARGDEKALERLHESELEAPCVTGADFARRSHRYLATREYERALEFARQGLATLSNAEPALLYNAAAALVRLNRRSDAIAYLARLCVDVSEVSRTGTFLRAALLLEEERYDEAIAAADALLEVTAGTSLDAALLRARALERAQRPEEAERALRERMADGAKRVAVELARLLVSQGRLAEAQDVAASALRAS